MENHETHLLWEIAEDVNIHVIHDREYPLFQLEDISELFGYDSAMLYHFFKRQIWCEEHDGPNQSFVHTDEGVYVSVLIPLLLAKTTVLDGRLDEAKAWDHVKTLGRIVEELMEYGELYMLAQTRASIKLLEESFGV